MQLYGGAARAMHASEHALNWSRTPLPDLPLPKLENFALTSCLLYKSLITSRVLGCMPACSLRNVVAATLSLHFFIHGSFNRLESLLSEKHPHKVQKLTGHFCGSRAIASPGRQLPCS